nr:aminomethyltransferase [uncultured bacterium]
MIQPASQGAYEAATHGAGLVDRSHRGRIVVSGRDRAGYLQGLLTNDISALTAGRGCYAAYLTAQGRMITDLLVYELGDVILLTLPGDVKAAVLAKLDQFIFSEDVALGDVTETFSQLALVGPAAAGLLAGVLQGVTAGELAALPEHGSIRASFDTQAAIVVRVSDTGEPGFDVFVDRSYGERFKAAAARAGAHEVDAATADAIRIEAGIPVFHRDMDEDTIPLEAGIESRAISLTKGCYVGQEVIIRVLHRGHGRVARKLVGLVMDGTAVPAPGTGLRADERDAGKVTSATLSPALGKPIALAYVQRDFVSPGTRLTVDGAPATVTTLPFVHRQA